MYTYNTSNTRQLIIMFLRTLYFMEHDYKYDAEVAVKKNMTLHI